MEAIHKDIVSIELDSVTLVGSLHIPSEAKQIVVFAHGSGSSRLSPRNNFVAEFLQKRTIGTLLFDLLTETEDLDPYKRFDIELLTERLIEVTEWLKDNKLTKNLPISYFGASTGAASALNAAAHYGHAITSVVSRGGRPDLAMESLFRVSSPTLLIVGGLDTDVLTLNQRAYDELRCEKKLEVVEGATHLFAESGKLEEAANLAANWFNKSLNRYESFL